MPRKVVKAPETSGREDVERFKQEWADWKKSIRPTESDLPIKRHVIESYIEGQPFVDSCRVCLRLPSVTNLEDLPLSDLYSLTKCVETRKRYAGRKK